MSTAVIRVSFLKIILSLFKCYYKLEMAEYTIKFVSNRSSFVVGYEAISSLEIVKNYVYYTLVFKTSSRQEYHFKGLSVPKIEKIKAIYKTNRSQIDSIRKRFNALLPKLKALDEWLKDACAGKFWVNNKSLNAKIEATKEFELFCRLPPEASQVFGAHGSTVQHIARFLESSAAFRRLSNRFFVRNELDQFHNFFDSVEKNPLTKEQRKAILSDEDATLTIASAGSGKTSLLVGKVGYLLKKGYAKPEEITVLAFNKKAAEEIKARIQERLSDQLAKKCNTSTFHKFGLDIIAKATKEKPSLAKFVENERNYLTTIEKFVAKTIQNPACALLVRRFFISYFKPYKDPFSFNTLGDYYSYVKNHDLLTLKGDYVKSFEELEIANFLFVNSIDYEYEKPYEYKTADINHRQYKPDFYLTENKVYIEHFAINRDETTPSFIDQEKYIGGIHWKRQEHARQGTILIETYSYLKKEGILLTELEKALKAHGVKLSPLSQKDLFNQLNDKGYVSQFSKLCATFLNLYKGQGARPFNDLKVINHEKSLDQERYHAFLDLFAYVYQSYEQELTDSNCIDFHDMIRNAVKIIQKPSFRSSCQYLLIDEFQDISAGRADLVRAIQKHNPNLKLFCVGDDWQSIYRFTGSDISFMTALKEYFGFTEVRYLEKTFRFNDRIASVASKFIQRNPCQISKKVVTEKIAEEPAVFLMSSKKHGKKKRSSLTIRSNL